MKALLTNYRQSPRKVRSVARAIVGKRADQALLELGFLARRAANPLGKVLASAIANAKAQGIDVSTLIVKKASVDGGVTLKRSMPRARGSAFQILKRSSHVYVELGTAAPKKAKKSAGKKAAVVSK